MSGQRDSNLIVSLLRIIILAAGLVILQQVAVRLLERATPPFPAPRLVHRGKVLFDTSRLASPTLLAIDVSRQGRIALLDSRSGEAQVFAPDGKLLNRTPIELPDAGKLKRPLDLAFGENEELYLADTGNQRVVRFDPDGTIQVMGKPGVYDGQFVLPTSLMIQDEYLYVLDTALCRVQQFSPAGFFVGKSGRKGDFPGGFRMPVSLMRDPESALTIIDSRKATLSKFDLLLRLAQERRIAAPRDTFTLTRGASAGDGLSFYLSKPTQEIAVFYQNVAVDLLTPEKLALGGDKPAFWTDLAGRQNTLYLLDGKNRAVDRFEIQ